MRDWRIGSLFAGIGGLELGLERAGLGRTTVQVACDPFALSILERHWPEADRFTDVREVSGADLGRPEVLCGGFPCQDVSQAGKGAGLQGERSGLWVEFARLIGEVGPEIAVLENVAILTRRGLDQVLGDLASLGYDAEWDCIPASSVGAPHQRDRIFIVAYPNDSRHLDGSSRIFPTETRFPAQREPVASGPLVAHANGHARDEGRSGDAAEVQGRRDTHRGGQRPDLPDAEGARLPVGEGSCRPEARQSRPECPGGNAGVWAPEPGVGRVADGVPSRVDRLRCLGNAVVPQVAEYVGGLIVNAMQTNLENQPDPDAVSSGGGRDYRPGEEQPNDPEGRA